MYFEKHSACVCECTLDQLVKTGSDCAEEKLLARAADSESTNLLPTLLP